MFYLEIASFRCHKAYVYTPTRYCTLLQTLKIKHDTRTSFDVPFFLLDTYTSYTWTHITI